MAALLTFNQSRENKDRYQSYGNYVAVILAQALQPDSLRNPSNFSTVANAPFASRKWQLFL